jgi:TolA-binding protein
MSHRRDRERIARPTASAVTGPGAMREREEETSSAAGSSDHDFSRVSVLSDRREADPLAGLEDDTAWIDDVIRTESAREEARTNAAFQTQFQAAFSAYRHGRYLDAARTFESLASSHPQSATDLLYNACQAYQRYGAQHGDLGARRARRDTEEAFADPSSRAQAQEAMHSGIAAYQAGEYPRAAHLFRTAYESVPAPEFQYNLGMALMHSGHPADALEAFGLARAAGIHVPERLLRRAERERNRTGDLSERDLEALTESNDEAIDSILSDARTDDAEVLFHTATRSFLDGRFDDAAQQFHDVQTTLSDSRGRPDVYLAWNEAMSRFRIRQYAEAVPLFRQALSLRR